MARTVRLDDDLDPVLVGARTGLLWSSPTLALAGLGRAQRIPLPGGTRALSQAGHPLRALAGTDEVGLPGTGPLAFAALPFHPDQPGELVVPDVVLGRDGEGRRWLTVMDGCDPAHALDRLRSTLADPPSPGDDPSRYEVVSEQPAERWRAQVAEVRDRIAGGELTKVVLARRLVLRTDVPIDPADVLDRLRQRFPTALLFAVDGFLGASPELLVSRMGDVVRAHPLAGTAARASDPVVDAGLAARLLASDKDRWEHRITIDWLLDTLLPFCSYVDAEPEPSIVTLANVHHLGTRVQGRLSQPAATALELVAALHPTPAVGGEPQDRALEVIARYEPEGRGRYAGPVGWVDGAGNGQFAVGIRSAELDGTTVRLSAGVGVVADSDPRAELAETRAKFAALLGALVQP